MSNHVHVRGLHHVAMKVKDFDASIAFYTQVIGFPVKVTWGQGDKRAALLDMGNGNYVELFAGAAAGDRPDGHWMHLALRCDNTDAALERVRKAGCTVTMEPANIDIPSNPVLPVRIAFFKGPDGEVIEFFQNSLT